ncbi:NEW3 domain-containing protein [Intrasporangium sp. DVR]|uniref:NEW3 domain-containing protein n=1 Tax=Intrasporangium sp. DVR TaxID=3127867 RepID=UPI00313A7011
MTRLRTRLAQSRPVVAVLAGAALLAGGLMAPPSSAAPSAPGEASGAVTVSISEVDLEGPAIAPVVVTVDNASSARLRNLSVALQGPTGWAVYPVEQSWKKAVAPGASVALDFSVQVPAPRSGFHLYTFTATATYGGGDGAGTAVGTRTQRTGSALPNLAAAYNNVGVTDESNPTPGNFDGYGNSFSAQKLADQGVTPGATVSALGADFVWPSAAPGTAGNVAAAGQAITFGGQGSRLAFLGSGASYAASGQVSVYYTDGSKSTGTLGFPNWSFQEADAHGATLVVSSVGRNRPNGYGDSAYAYRVFANSIEIDPAKTVEFVVLPGNGAVHIFDMQIVP